MGEEKGKLDSIREWIVENKLRAVGSVAYNWSPPNMKPSVKIIHASKTYCGYCQRVKQLFSQLQATYKVIELDQESDGDTIQAALAKWTGQRTVPNVFIGDEHIGGSDVVLEKHQQGKLIPILSEAGAIPKHTTHS